VTPALLLVAVLTRPTIAPLALGLGIAWTLDARGLRVWLAAAGLALVVASPWLVWNVLHLGTPWPSGQWHSNARQVEHVFDLSAPHLGYALSGLLVSPGRGLLWYAPVVLLGVVTALRHPDRLVRVVAFAVIAQVALIAMFFRWYGGFAFGPRLLAETVWLGAWLALACARHRRVLFGVAIAVTVFVGQLGLWRFRSSQWETRRMPDIDENALWDFVDSPIAAAFVSDDGIEGLDAQPREEYRCGDGVATSR
jgi:hypothetical protein